MNVICTEAERAAIVGGATRLVVPGDPICHSPDVNVDWWECVYCGKLYDVWPAPAPVCMYVAPKRWVDATGPCPTCNGIGSIRCYQPRHHFGPCDRLEMSDGLMNCPDCIDGRKRVALAVPCHHVIEGVDGWWCGCGDGLSAEEHAAHGACATCQMFDRAEPCTGSVVFAHATVEVLPVHDEHPPTEVRRFMAVGSVAALLVDRDANEGTDFGFNSQPVPGRDWIVLLSNVEMT